jgi:hypothetical protein
LNLRIASDAAELRAAAFLRASSFHEFNPERSEFAQKVRIPSANGSIELHQIRVSQL